MPQAIFNYELEDEDIDAAFEHLENGSLEGTVERDEYFLDFEFDDEPYIVIELNKARVEYHDVEEFESALEEYEVL